MDKIKITQGQKEGLHEFVNENTDIGHLPMSEELLEIFIENRKHWCSEQRQSIADFTPEQFALLLCGWYEVKFEEEYPKGSFVVKMGEVWEVDHPQADGHKDNGTCFLALKRSDGVVYHNILRKEIRKATAEEIEREKKRRFWESLGREVDEYRIGDVVRHEYAKGLGEITKEKGDFKNHVLWSQTFCDSEKTVNKKYITLITPVEKRLDIDA